MLLMKFLKPALDMLAEASQRIRFYSRCIIRIQLNSHGSGVLNEKSLCG